LYGSPGVPRWAMTTRAGGAGGGTGGGDDGGGGGAGVSGARGDGSRHLGGTLG
jgi:hypothetical protein